MKNAAVVKRFAVLLVLLIAPTALVSTVRSTPLPTLTFNLGGYGVSSLTGTGWTPFNPVTIYLDTVDSAHRLTVANANWDGSFYATFPQVSSTTQGAHVFIAVQGTTQVTQNFTVSAVSPPDDRLLNPILAIQNKLDTVNGEVKAVEAKLDVGGSFYNFVNNWFNTVNGKLGNIETKIDNSKATQIIAYYDGSVVVSGGTVEILPNSFVLANKPALFTVSVVTTKIDAGYIRVDRQGPGASVVVKWLIPAPSLPDMNNIQDTFTFGGQGTDINVNNRGSSDVTVYFTLMVQGSPDTVITLHQ